MADSRQGRVKYGYDFFRLSGHRWAWLSSFYQPVKWKSMPSGRQRA